MAYSMVYFYSCFICTKRMCANLINWEMQISFSFSYYFCLLTGFFSYHNDGFSSFLRSCQFLLFPDNTEVLLQIHSSSRLLKLLAEVFFNLYETFLFVLFNSFGEVVGGRGALWGRNGSKQKVWLEPDATVRRRSHRIAWNLFLSFELTGEFVF